jgi:predicted nucleotidyltransferase/HEPN domain-containing protein
MVHTEKQMRLAMTLKEALIDAYDPEAVILFGSLGRGDADEFSDVDLLVVMETYRHVKDVGEEMAERFNHVSKDKHMIVRTPKDFGRQMDIPGTIVFSATREGQILFEKPGWRTRHRPDDSYATRKKEVMREEYAASARDFLGQAQASLQEDNLFRCRDFARFAAVRALKGLFVKHDIHPPRETDLGDLLNKAKQLEPDLVRHKAFVAELNGYCPGRADSTERKRCLGLFERTSRFADEMLARYDLD